MTDESSPDAALSAPIESHVSELATTEELPVVAITACLARYQEAGPLLCALLSRGAEAEITDEAKATQLFRALHIIGGARDRSVFPTLLDLLRLPEDDLEWLLGDALTETLPRITVGVFDGDVDALLDAIADQDRDETARDSLLRAAAFLTWEGRIDRARMIAFLERFGTDAMAQDGELVWEGWVAAIGLLGLRDLQPLVLEAEKREALVMDLFERDRFEEMLEQAERSPGDRSRFEDENLGYIEDVVKALMPFVTVLDDSWPADDEEGVPAPWPDLEPAGRPVVNPWRHVGRNDPCPCGSGKKAKRCCLAA